MVKKRIRAKKDATVDFSSGGVKKDAVSQHKKVSKVPKAVKKEDLVEQMYVCKKEMQEMRFGLSQKGQQKGVSRRDLRKQLALTAMRLTMLRKNGVLRP